MKYRITRDAQGFGGVKVPQERIIDVDTEAGEKAPDGAVQCEDQTVAVAGWASVSSKAVGTK